jgi:hypothetical protein
MARIPSLLEVAGILAFRKWSDGLEGGLGPTGAVSNAFLAYVNNDSALSIMRMSPD